MEKESNTYSLPVRFRSSLKPGMHALYLFMICLFGAFLFIPGNDAGMVIAKIIIAVVVAFFLVWWLYMGVLRLSTLTLSENGVAIRTLFGSRRISWQKIESVATYTQNRYSFIGIVSTDKINTEGKSTLSILFSMRYALTIPLYTFSKVQPDKLYATLDRFSKERNPEPQVSLPEDRIGRLVRSETEEYHPVSSLLKALAVSVLCGVLYGTVTAFTGVNYLVIPFIGLMAVVGIAYWGNTGSVSVLFRVILGLLCMLMVVLAPFVKFLVLARDTASTDGFFPAAKFFADCMVQNPGPVLIYWILGAVFFVIGAAVGLSNRFTRQIHKRFMKKLGAFPMKRDKRDITVYLMDYADYEDKNNTFAMHFAPNHCLIERKGKRLRNFYLPAELFTTHSVPHGDWPMVTMGDGKTYFQLGVGGDVQPEPYGYECMVILDEEKNPEFLSITVDT